MLQGAALAVLMKTLLCLQTLPGLIDISGFAINWFVADLNGFRAMGLHCPQSDIWCTLDCIRAKCIADELLLCFSA